MVRVERDLERLDLSELGEELLQLKWLHGLWDLAHKDVVIHNLLGVGPEQVVVIGEGTAWLVWHKLEVSELLAGGLELVFLWDGDDGRVAIFPSPSIFSLLFDLKIWPFSST